MKALAHVVDDLVDTHRTFGTEGPVYRVLRKVNEETVRVSVVETGEELDYPARQAADDPEAA
jgi:hypothetical protein